ncbi:MAG: Re/Si-specific NAD(P)(+) transhydrogenase subunit alpha [Candidatus Omnitrophica bacterium]|nr:Re/Si-specific NAD(P)(+) transhydrogenase subunit alpha [Candidatus Omnitrophota bacterium]
MKIAIPKEIVVNEHRVAIIPETVAKLVRAGMNVSVESKAGENADFPDKFYADAGAKIVSDVQTLLSDSDVVFKVQKPVLNQSINKHEIDMIKQGAVLIGLLQPGSDPETIQMLTKNKITGFSLNFIPRISRAQSMDILSSQSSISGYKSVLLAANELKRFFPMMMTAAGTIIPAKVFILGAGVAGLQAIATARRLGAIVQAFDVRPAVKQEVESLGAKFVGLAIEEAASATGYAKEVSQEHQVREKELIAQYIKDADIAISTALIPGKRAPILITREMVETMKPGSVIVDIAAEQGGNCELTQADKSVLHNNVTILGPVNIPSMMSCHASQMYSRNIFSFFNLIVQEGRLNMDFNDPIIKQTCITHQGEILKK